MAYTIKEAAKIFNLTTHTIRYYDKENLLPFIKRDSVGNRIFTDKDIEWLGLICCLKNTGMPIKQIKLFIEWCLSGDDTLETRRQLLINHRKDVLMQIEELNKNLEKINGKIAHYNQLCEVHKEKKVI